MKVYTIFFVASMIAAASATCHERILACFDGKVNQLLNDQISVELKGHYTYLYLSHFFLQHDYYYPKVAKYFRAKSDEEMQHAEKFIDYQNQRGGTYEITRVEKKSDGKCNAISSLKQGFECAVELEIDVTKALNDLLTAVSDVKVAYTDREIDENNKDLLLAQSILVTASNVTKPFHLHRCNDLEPVETKLQKVEYVELSEMIAHDFLGHQLEDTKELANYVRTLSKFGNDEALGSYLVDQHLEL